MCDIDMCDSTRCPYDAVTNGLCLIHRLREIEGYDATEMGIPFGVELAEYRRTLPRPTCKATTDDGVSCPEPAKVRGWCSAHYERHLKGWSDADMRLPLGSRRQRPSKPPALCEQLMHTGERCGRPANGVICPTHRTRRAAGWSPERMGEPIRTRGTPS